MHAIPMNVNQTFISLDQVSCRRIESCARISEIPLNSDTWPLLPRPQSNVFSWLRRIGHCHDGRCRTGAVIDSIPHLRYFNRSGGWELGTGPSLVVLDKGFGKNLSTTTLRKGVYAFIFSQKGLMGGIGIQGSKITKITLMSNGRV